VHESSTVLPLPISALCHDVSLIQLHFLIRTIVSDTFDSLAATSFATLCFHGIIIVHIRCAIPIGLSHRKIPSLLITARYQQIPSRGAQIPTYSSKDVFPRPIARVSTLPTFLVAYLLQSISHPQTTGHAHPDPHCPNAISPLHL
jgi:hypothetical protein